MRNRIRSCLVNVGLIAASIGLMLALGEIGVRLFTRSGPSLQIRDPVVGKRYHRGFHDTVFVPESQRRVELRFNRDGMRGPDRPLERPAGVRRVALVGDSHIVAVATDEEDTLVARLEALLNESAAGAERWEVLNFGVSSASTGQEMVLYREVASRYDPEVVVCAFHVGNDFADNSPRLSSARRIYFDLTDDGRLERLPLRAGSGRAGEWLNLHSRLYVWWKTRMAVLRANARELTGVPPTKRVFSTEEDEDLLHAWRLTARLLEAFRDEVESRGARLVVLVIPAAEQIYDDLWQHVLDLAGEEASAYDRDHPDRQLVSMAREAGVPLLTMTSEFRARSPSRSSTAVDERLFYNGTGHLNVAGQEIAAGLLRDFLVGTLAIGDQQHVPAAEPRAVDDAESLP